MKKRILSIILAVILLFSLCGCGTKQENDIIILYTNDVHCAVDEGIGYAGLAAMKAEYEKEGFSVILADCGDAIQGEPIGTLSQGEYIVDIMNETGYDVATIGNHEFDYGAERFLELADKAEYTYVSCNFTSTETGETVFEPYTVIEREGTKIAFIGITTPFTVTSSSPVYFQNENGDYIYNFKQDETGEAVYEAVQASIDKAKKDGADYVIALSHTGIGEEFSPWSSKDIIENTAGIDVIIDGHSHSTVPCTRIRDKNGDWVLLTQTGTKFSSVGMLLIQKDGSVSTGLIEEYENKAVETAGFIADKQGEFEEVLQKAVAYTEVELTVNDPETGERRVRSGETNLGDLCADAYRIVTGADVAFTNGGGVRDSIAAGDITNEDILKVHPFGNEICVTEATGEDILNALELGCYNYPNEDGSFPQVSGMTFEIHTDIEPTVVLDENGMFLEVEGEYRVQNVMINGEPLVLDKIYTVACHDYYIKEAGGGMNMFLDNILLQDCIMLDNQILIEYITEYLGGSVGEEYADPYGQGRIVIK